ncbi:MAG TPA: Fic family protein [Fimbriimonadaceae bacterium]|nr:Fic family protein [Fimbriimonadaceae bacterium]
MTHLEQLTQAKAWLDACRPLSPEVARELKSRVEVRLTYHSTAIEGNTLTQSETQIVLEKGITIGGKSLIEHLEVIGHRDAMDFVLELARTETPFDARTLREIHSLVMKGQGHGNVGTFRTINVMAAGTEYRYPDHLQIPKMMEEFIAWWNAPSPEHPVLWASEAHLRFVTIHPFADGNGRVGRLLLNLALLRAGYPIAVIPVERRAAYIGALHEAQAGRSRDALDRLVMDAVEASLRETLQAAMESGVTQPEGAQRWLEAQ